jgi:hypothetical protein
MFNTFRFFKKPVLVLLVVFSLIFRLWLTDKAWHVDMWSNAGWGEWIYQNGPGKFYDNNIWTYAWPTQPPLISSVYAWNKKLYIELLGRMAGVDFKLQKRGFFGLSGFVTWFGYGKINNEIPYQIGYVVTMKFLPIMADGLIAWLLWLITKKAYLSLVFLLSPFSWYISAMWGQYDGVAFAFTLAGLYLLQKNKWFILSPVLISAGVLIKPTGIILIPLAIYYYLLKNKYHWIWKIMGVGAAVALFWITTMPYTYKNPFEFARYDLKRIIFEKAEPRVSTNAFNFWRIIIGDKAVNQWQSYLGLPAVIWGILAVAVINFLAMRKMNYWEGFFTVGAGSYLLMTGMVDRYLYAGIVLGLILVKDKAKWLKAWLIWSFIFWLNLYNQWWVPGWLEPLKSVLIWRNVLITRILSLISVVIFARWLLGNFQKPLFRPIRMRKNPAGGKKLQGNKGT